MLKPSRSHPDYVAFVQRKLTEGKVPEPLRHWPAKDKLRLLDLTPALPILAMLYAQTGRPGIPPEDLLRSLIAMTLCEVTSVDLWVAKMREHPFYAIFSGFDPYQVPGVGTFYDFMDRLVGLDIRKINPLCRPKRKRQHTQHDQQAAKDKNRDTSTHQGIVARLADHFLRQTAPPPADGPIQTDTFSQAERILQAIFYACVVNRSIDLGLIDLNPLLWPAMAPSCAPGPTPTVASAAPLSVKVMGRGWNG